MPKVDSLPMALSVGSRVAARTFDFLSCVFFLESPSLYHTATPAHQHPWQAAPASAWGEVAAGYSDLLTPTTRGLLGLFPWGQREPHSPQGCRV